MQETQQDRTNRDTGESVRDFPSRAEVLVEVRRMVEQAAAGTRLAREGIEDLLTAVDEAAANAIRHGTPSGKTEPILRITCITSPDSVEVRVRDFGTGFSVPESTAMPAPDAAGGRGLPLMVALANSVAIESTPQGTTVTLIKRADS